MSVLALSARTKPKQHLTPFDTDSKPIGIDNRCTACISHDLNDFESPPVPIEWQLKALVAQNPLVWAKELHYGCERVIMGRNMTFGFPILSVPQVHVADS
jgi:hypothetical protein